jgi:hypothetical protein
LATWTTKSAPGLPFVQQSPLFLGAAPGPADFVATFLFAGFVHVAFGCAAARIAADNPPDPTPGERPASRRRRTTLAMKLTNLARVLVPALAPLLLAASSAAQFTLPNMGNLPTSYQIVVDQDPALANLTKSYSYSKTYGPTDANIAISITANGSVLVVQDEQGILTKATGQAKADAKGSIYGFTLLGAQAQIDALAQNATWSYNGTTATVTNLNDSGFAKGYVKLGSYVLLNQTKPFSGDVLFNPSFAFSQTSNIFNVSKTYWAGGFIPVTLRAKADAITALLANASLDPVVTNGAIVGARAKISGAASGNVTASASIEFDAYVASVGLQFVAKLADARVDANITAQNSSVTGAVVFSVIPLQMWLNLIWSAAFWSGSDNIWNWSAAQYSKTYTL